MNSATRKLRFKKIGRNPRKNLEATPKYNKWTANRGSIKKERYDNYSSQTFKQTIIKIQVKINEP